MADHSVRQVHGGDVRPGRLAHRRGHVSAGRRPEAGPGPAGGPGRGWRGRDQLAQAPPVSDPGLGPRPVHHRVGALRGRTRPRWTGSSTTCPSAAPRRSRRSRWTPARRTPRPSGPEHRRRRSVSTHSTSSNSPVTPWTLCVVRCGSPAAASPTRAIAKTYRGARWALRKNPDNLTPTQAETLAALKKTGGCCGAHQLKEALSGVRRRPGTANGDEPQRTLVLQGATLPNPRLRQSCRHHPQEQGRHRRRREPRPVQRARFILHLLSRF